MSKIRSKDTNPEKKVRKALWAKGFRYKIHDKSIIGTPDVSNKSKKIAIFVDGCFWHGCPKCYNPPKTNVEYWKHKLSNNKNRRKKIITKLSSENWKIFELWECDISKDVEKITNNLVNMIKIET